MRNGNETVFGLYGAILLGISIAALLTLSCKKTPALSTAKPHQFTGTEKPVSDPNMTVADPNAPVQWTHPRTEERLQDRRKMVDALKRVYGINDKKILHAMQGVPRHWFVSESRQHWAYFDGPLPIGEGQTISQPFIVAYMTGLLELDKTQKVLEIGTGSGYQAAVLTEFTPHVYSIEIVESLGKAAAKRLKEFGYSTVQVKIGDGYKGWPEHAPFDAIIVTCAPDHIPPDLLDQLKVGGKMVIPVGSVYRVQDLILVTKDKNGKIHKESKMPVRFVPLTRDKNLK